MQSAAVAVPDSKTSHLLGTILSTLAVLFLLFDSTIHLVNIPPVVEAFKQLGFPASAAVPVGVIELLCLMVYLAPRTSMLGAVLLTGYLGGAVAIHLRVGSPLFSHLLFPVYIGALLWAGLYLRDERLRALISGRAEA
ncbi:MAG: DoxX family protein [Armatimonadetes bacterium]|jgi:hypothetical protein|nr:DoxX family protein [Armatimonadota bacterium]